MKFSLIAFVATGLAAAGSLAGPIESPNLAPAAQTAPSGDVYRLRTSIAEGSCAVSRGPAISESISELTVETGCEALLVGVDRARFWQESEDGSVAFTDNWLDPIVTFSIADGVAYESFAPGAPTVSLAME